MKWYQPIECDNTVKKPLVCDDSNFEEYDYNEDDFKNGEEIFNWPCDIYMKASQKKYDGVPDDVVQNAYMVPVYSKKLMDELNKAELRGIQYLPIRVLNFKEDVQNTFYIANFLNYIEAFDFTKSIYNRFSEDFPNPNVRGTIAGVMKFVLLEEKLKEFDVVRLREYNQRFFVSEKFVDVFKKKSFYRIFFQRDKIGLNKKCLLG